MIREWGFLSWVVVISIGAAHAQDCKNVERTSFILAPEMKHRATSHVARDLGSRDIYTFINKLKKEVSQSSVLLSTIDTQTELPSGTKKRTLLWGSTQYRFLTGDPEDSKSQRTITTKYFTYCNGMFNFLTNHLVSRSYLDETKVYNEPLRQSDSNVVERELSLENRPPIKLKNSSGYFLAESLGSPTVQELLQKVREKLDSYWQPQNPVRRELLLGAYRLDRCSQDTYKATLYLGGDFPTFAACGPGCYVDFIHDIGKITLLWKKDSETGKYVLFSVQPQIRQKAVDCRGVKCFE
ncbi:MAG: hypothetical protein AB1540_09820 [Bdellovibrionota bacterium]